MKYEVWHVVNPPNKGKRYPVSSPVSGAKLIDTLATADLADDTVWGNCFGLEYWDEQDQEWYEWYDFVAGQGVLELCDEATLIGIGE